MYSCCSAAFFALTSVPCTKSTHSEGIFVLGYRGNYREVPGYWGIPCQYLRPSKNYNCKITVVVMGSESSRRHDFKLALVMQLVLRIGFKIGPQVEHVYSLRDRLRSLTRSIPHFVYSDRFFSPIFFNSNMTSSLLQVLRVVEYRVVNS